MNVVVKGILNAASKIAIDIKKHYKVYRGLLRVAKSYVRPHIRPLYGVLDRKMVMLGREIQVRVFLPKKNSLKKTLIFFHGGGWVTGDIDTYTKICVHMAALTRHTVVSVNYRLAPEHPFPAGLEDCYYVAREIYGNPSLVGCQAEDITLIGDSAGGNLAAAVSLMARARGEFLPRKQILIYPATYYEHGESSPFPSIRENGAGYLLTSEKIQNYMELYVRNEQDKLNPYVAPLLAEDLTNQPETLIITAEYDPLRDEAEAYGIKLREFGNAVRIARVENTIHGFLSLPKRSKAVARCYGEINRFLRDQKNRGEDM